MLAGALAQSSTELRDAGSVAECRALLASWSPELAVTGFALNDGDAFDLLELLEERRVFAPVVVMRGPPGAAPRSEDAFRLAQRGVRALVPRPIAAEHLEHLERVGLDVPVAPVAPIERAIDEILRAAPDLTPLLRAVVGHHSVHHVEEQVRATMVAEALARSHGNISYAARLLKISRQLLQHIRRQA